ncbi:MULTISPECIES: cysteine desulfurase family protein [Cyanophyceae]|uniref:cysteine desulfurase family protein n=1 Tax=Cyanophyceae TaxID=3028117 RepID=UPI001689AF91|nr:MULTISPECIES: cysteine desulfurase family protein [Cyanophyceae]MBD1915013.1 cysteine desulfurase [Phormidium sp. FACHB-77]MBD2032800.1 cysteine desulfurase [Phormidium sp. FACHB-322]MBD2049945.1 cysteine desulfurase [Leptolyngbya sp. FACHB-60]
MVGSSNSKIIYLDYHATTPTDPRVAKFVLHYMTEEFGNASSIDNEVGDRAEAAVKEATRHVADLVGATPRDILFTSGATESINLAIQGTIQYLERSSTKPRIAISTAEHKAVLDTCDALHKQGRIELIHIPVDTQARLDLDQLEKACASGIHLLCVMAANNEVGTIYPMEKIAAITQSHQVPFLCDASQSVGKVPIKFNEWGIAMLALSAHKFYGPQGVGALVVRRDHQLEPLLYGGGQQKGLRPGTLNLPGIVGLGEACRLRAEEMAVDEVEIGKKRDHLQARLQAQIPDLVINGDPQNHLAGNLHISIPGIPNSAIIARVRHSLAISTGSACSSGVETPSHVLRAMGLAEPVVEGALRIGLGKFSTDNDIHQAAEILTQAVQSVKQAMA